LRRKIVRFIGALACVLFGMVTTNSVLKSLGLLTPPTPNIVVLEDRLPAPYELAFDDGAYGLTYCSVQLPSNRRAVAWINLRLLEAKELYEPVIAHERMHQRQMFRFKTCEEFWQYSEEHAVEIEAEAFAEQARVFSKAQRVLLADAVEEFAWWLVKGYDFGLTHEQAVKAIAEFLYPKPKNGPLGPMVAPPPAPKKAS
jgi:hypothetical protein